MPKPRRPSATWTARSVAFALVQARPEPEAGRAAMLQWETDVMAVSLAVRHLTGYDDSRFRIDCQGPKGDA